MKHDPATTANALGVTVAVVFVACRILVGLFPDLSFAIAQSWFHGIALSKVDIITFDMATFILGLVSSTVTAWLVGYLFGTVYNTLIGGAGK